jgi:CheY-like chemotaxis protein
MRPLALVVENDTGTRKLLDVLLTRFGCEVDVVANGLDALLLLDSIDYDLAVIDLFIPGASGAEILEWMRTERPAALERTIVLSSATPAHMIRVQNAYPPVRTIRKPFDLTEILTAVEAVTQTRERTLTALDDFSRRSIVAGAKAGILVRRDDAHISLVHDFGYGRQVVEKWFPMSANDPLPLCTCIRDGQPRWLASLAYAAVEFPQIVATLQQNQSLALASVPILRGGQVIGAAGWTFREPHLFDRTEQDAFLAIAADAVAMLDLVHA